MTALLKRIARSLWQVYERRDLSPWDVDPAGHLPVYGVYHVMMDTGWQQLAAAQITNLKNSGLLDATAKFYVSAIAGRADDVETLRRMVDSDKFEVVSLQSDPRQYEYPALRFIRERCEHEDCLIYYFHSKGISYQLVHSDDRLFRSFVGKITAWREMLEYFVFDKWRVAVNALSNGFDTYGCYRWPPRNYTMFSGNFWWVNAAFVRQLPDFAPDVVRINRFYSEVWLFEKPQRCFSAFETVADLYFVQIPRSIYADGTPRLTDRLRFVFTYNYRKVLKHVFHLNYKKRCQQKFQQLKSTVR